MSRRASDKTQARLYNLLLALAVATSVPASMVSFKAIRALDGFDAFIDSATKAAERKSLLPEGY